MSPFYFLDADTCIHLVRRNPPEHLLQKFVDEAGGLGLSSVVLFELRVGVAKSPDPARARRRVDRFCAPLSIVNFDDAAAEHAADIRADLESRGQKIGPFDTLIAGHARSVGAAVVTGNMREFSRVPGLRCENWTSPVGGESV